MKKQEYTVQQLEYQLDWMQRNVDMATSAGAAGLAMALSDKVKTIKLDLEEARDREYAKSLAYNDDMFETCAYAEVD